MGIGQNYSITDRQTVDLGPDLDDGAGTFVPQDDRSLTAGGCGDHTKIRVTDARARKFDNDLSRSKLSGLELFDVERSVRGIEHRCLDSHETAPFVLLMVMVW